MAIRTVNGNTFTEDGWPLVDQAGCVWIDIPGCDATIQVQQGIPAAVIRGVAADFNAYVEKLRDEDSASWTEGNSVLGDPGRNNGSNHLGGTAADFNWNSHKFRVRGTFNAAQMVVIRQIIDFWEGWIFWAGDWDDPVDEMHWQMGYGTYKRTKAQWDDFAKRKLRSDGLSTFRRGPLPGENTTPPSVPATPVEVGFNRAAALETLYLAVEGFDEGDAAKYLDAIVAGLAQSKCKAPNSIAMWLAQVGHECADFSTTEEFGKGAGKPYFPYYGRTWIQITWDYNYRAFGEWCAAQGLIDDAHQFVDNPGTLADLKWAGIGAAWYWTTQRPINALIAADDNAVFTNDLGTFRGAMSAVTAAINGGQNGLADRQARYNHAIALGDKLLNLVVTETPSGSGEVDKEQADRIEAKLDEILSQLNGQGNWAQTGSDPKAIATLEATYASGKPMSLLDMVTWIKLHISPRKTPNIPKATS